MVSQRTTDHVHYSNEHFHQAAQRLLHGDGQREEHTCPECRHRYGVAIMLASFQMASEAGGDDHPNRTMDALMDKVDVVGSKPIYDFERKRETPQ